MNDDIPFGFHIINEDECDECGSDVLYCDCVEDYEPEEDDTLDVFEQMQRTRLTDGFPAEEYA